ncbi:MULTISPECIES: PhzF family phenazine biosynthesis protein [Brachybacterium]|uniref:Phenazine biosynthesis protein PhzF n=2 Tax=Brachybacterium TaxID=43668 RepID=A0A3R8RNC1_9MICO|nr:MULTISPECIES: PhzF family phenazine biosynthesis protein [Brachybacterium]RRR17637.1 phenazine biosynthesis protein PhzF [Brachybacterium paraconglomeratum]GLI29832.1 phenazine biosynthesis protein PhzF [Brachybacterium conglomeratum]GLK05991.1 phenazine biosynthesis protein PhzF [Brachybacterium conglomeratum]
MTVAPAPPRRRPFLQLDVFAEAPQRGNPLAVVLEAEDLADEDMQRIAQWTNLSETTFLLPPTMAEADYRVRIWTPSGELPFAGHPTLGTARAWLHAGGVPSGERIVQECAIGLVEVRRSEVGHDAGLDDVRWLDTAGPSDVRRSEEPAGERLAFAAPPLLREGPLAEDEVGRIAAALGIPRAAVRGHTWADNGPGWQVLELEDAEQVLSLEPDVAALGNRKVGVIGRRGSGQRDALGDASPDPDAAPLYEVRAFAPVGVEDPVTGSLNAGIGQWLVARGEAPERWTAAQGTALGREGRVHLEQAGDGTLWVGGSTVLTVEGTILA